MAADGHALGGGPGGPEAGVVAAAGALALAGHPRQLSELMAVTGFVHESDEVAVFVGLEGWRVLTIKKWKIEHIRIIGTLYLSV